MKIEKANQLNEYEMQHLRGTELYAQLMSWKYLIKCEDSDEAYEVWNEISAHCQNPWYIQKTDSYGEEYHVYFSTDRDASIMMRVNETGDSI